MDWRRFLSAMPPLQSVLMLVVAPSLSSSSKGGETLTADATDASAKWPQLLLLLPNAAAGDGVSRLTLQPVLDTINAAVARLLLLTPPTPL